MDIISASPSAGSLHVKKEKILYTTMHMRKQYSIEAAYPEFFEGNAPLAVIEGYEDEQRDDVRKMQQFLTSEAPGIVDEITSNPDNYLKTYDLDGYGYEYDMLVVPGTSRNTLVTSMEVATNVDPSRRFLSRRDRLTHALAVRAFVDPGATLVLQSQSALTLKRERGTMNYTDKEIEELASGSSGPITRRVYETLRQERRLHSRIHLFGSSLGGMVANDLGAALDNVGSVTSLEAPDIKDRSVWDLAKDMSVSGPHLWKNIKLGKLDAKVPELRQGVDTLAYWALSLLHPDTQATIARMQHNTHETQLLAGLKRNPNMGVVHAWAAKSAISPANENRALVAAVQAYENGKYARKVEGFELTSQFASHNSSNIPLAMAILVRRAMSLGKQSRTNESTIL
jgi:hypothetical protein